MGVDINILQLNCDQCENELIVDCTFELGTSADVIMNAMQKDAKDPDDEKDPANWQVTGDTVLCPECKPKPKYAGYSDGDVPKLQEGSGELMLNFLESQGIDDYKAMSYIVDAYDAGTPEERRLINLVLVALYGWTLQSIFEKAV